MTLLDSSLAIHARLRRALVARDPSLVPFVIDGQVAGRITADRTRRLAAMADVFCMRGDALAFVATLATPHARSAALARVARTLATEGALSAWRDERYAIAPAFGVPPWCELERAAARYFGIRTYAAHVNGLVREKAAVAMWLARRSLTKAIDPGMLDNLVGGGIAAGVSVAATVVKECWEEAGIDAPLAQRARPTGALHVERLHADGLQDEIVFVHDLWLPPDFVPANQDGEAVEHRRLGLQEIAATLGHDEGERAVTLDATLVALTALVREGAFDADATSRATLEALLHDLAVPAPGARDPGA